MRSHRVRVMIWIISLMLVVVGAIFRQENTGSIHRNDQSAHSVSILDEVDTTGMHHARTMRLGAPCEFGRVPPHETYSINTGEIVWAIMKAQLECAQIYSGLEASYRIEGYSIDTGAGTYAVRVANPAISDRVAGDGVLSGDWVLGKSVMFVHLQERGGIYTMTHGTGP